MEDVKGAFRSFLYGIFGRNTRRRQLLVSLWHSPYPHVREKYSRLADLWAEFLSLLLYEQPKLRLRTDHLCFFGPGTGALRVPYSALHETERNWLLGEIVPEGARYFSVWKQHENNQYQGEGLLMQEEKIVDAATVRLWGREMVHIFATLVRAQNKEFMRVELIAAIQSLMLVRKTGGADRFLLGLHNAMQNQSPFEHLLCWGYSEYDNHPEDSQQRRSHPTCTWQPAECEYECEDECEEDECEEDETKMLSY